MRNLFLAVFAVNIFVFLFYYYLPDTDKSMTVSVPANVPKLVLLSEVDKASLTPDESEVESVVKEKISNKVKEQKCFTIGPFREEAKVVSFRSRISKKVKKTGVRERQETLHWRHWVYLSDAGSKGKAVKLASALARKGLKDYYVIARGEYKNSVSLGHFIDKSLAEKRFKLVEKMGYKPKIQAIEKEYTLYWLDYVAKAGTGLSNQALADFELEESIHQFTRECGK